MTSTSTATTTTTCHEIKDPITDSDSMQTQSKIDELLHDDLVLPTQIVSPEDLLEPISFTDVELSFGLLILPERDNNERKSVLPQNSQVEENSVKVVSPIDEISPQEESDSTKDDNDTEINNNIEESKGISETPSAPEVALEDIPLPPDTPPDTPPRPHSQEEIMESELTTKTKKGKAKKKSQLRKLKKKRDKRDQEILLAAENEVIEKRVKMEEQNILMKNKFESTSRSVICTVKEIEAYEKAVAELNESESKFKELKNAIKAQAKNSSVDPAPDPYPPAGTFTPSAPPLSPISEYVNPEILLKVQHHKQRRLELESELENELNDHFDENGDRRYLNRGLGNSQPFRSRLSRNNIIQEKGMPPLLMEKANIKPPFFVEPDFEPIDPLRDLGFDISLHFPPPPPPPPPCATLKALMEMDVDSVNLDPFSSTEAKKEETESWTDILIRDKIAIMWEKYKHEKNYREKFPNKDLFSFCGDDIFKQNGKENGRESEPEESLKIQKRSNSEVIAAEGLCKLRDWWLETKVRVEPKVVSDPDWYSSSAIQQLESFRANPSPSSSPNASPVKIDNLKSRINQLLKIAPERKQQQQQQQQQQARNKLQVREMIPPRSSPQIYNIAEFAKHAKFSEFTKNKNKLAQRCKSSSSQAKQPDVELKPMNKAAKEMKLEDKKILDMDIAITTTAKLSSSVDVTAVLKNPIEISWDPSFSLPGSLVPYPQSHPNQALSNPLTLEDEKSVKVKPDIPQQSLFSFYGDDIFMQAGLDNHDAEVEAKVKPLLSEFANPEIEMDISKEVETECVPTNLDLELCSGFSELSDQAMVSIGQRPEDLGQTLATEKFGKALCRGGSGKERQRCMCQQCIEDAKAFVKAPGGAETLLDDYCIQQRSKGRVAYKDTQIEIERDQFKVQMTVAVGGITCSVIGYGATSELAQEEAAKQALDFITEGIKEFYI